MLSFKAVLLLELSSAKRVSDIYTLSVCKCNPSLMHLPLELVTFYLPLFSSPETSTFAYVVPGVRSGNLHGQDKGI